MRNRGLSRILAPAARHLPWLACALCLHGIAIGFDYKLHDPDSTLYEAIVNQLADQPYSKWLAPQFPEQRFKSGLFLEHTAVFFWPAALLQRLGVPRGALFANTLYYLLSLAVLFRLCTSLADRQVARLATFSYVVSPLGVQYLVRANHENAWGLAFLIGLLALVRMRSSPWWGVGLAGAAVLAVAIKGALGLLFFPAMAIAWLLLSRRPRELLWLAFAAAMVVLAAIGYEAAFRDLTGESFHASYLAIQTGYVAHHEQLGLGAKLLNPLYYLANIAWFALPGSLLAGWGLWRAARAKEALPASAKLALGVGGGVAALVSLMTRHAARYIFPVYPLLHVYGAEALLARTPSLRAWLERRDAALEYLLLGLLLAIAFLRMLASTYLYRFIDVF